jgi:hypothetical protein
MSTCAAHIPIGHRPRLIVDAHGQPGLHQDHCAQSVALHTLTDGCGQEWAYSVLCAVWLCLHIAPTAGRWEIARQTKP